MMTANVGRTRCSMWMLFSVVYGSSSGAHGSRDPAPTPTAYTSARLESHERSTGLLSLPTTSRFGAMCLLPDFEWCEGLSHKWAGSPDASVIGSLGRDEVVE